MKPNGQDNGPNKRKTFGGVLRDILINEEPLIFRKDIYAMASFLGGVAYTSVMALGGEQVACGLSCAIVCLVVRMLALRYSWHLPIMHSETDENA